MTYLKGYTITHLSGMGTSQLRRPTHKVLHSTNTCTSGRTLSQASTNRWSALWKRLKVPLN